MNNVLDDLSIASLLSAIEGNLFGLFQAFSEWPRAEAHDEKEIQWTMTDIPLPVFNSVLHAQLAPGRVDGVIESITAQAKSRNVPLLWWTGPTTRPANLGRYLEKHGFIFGGQIPGMAVDLGVLNEQPSTPDGFTFEQVKDDKTLLLWCQVFARGFGMPEFVVQAFYDFMDSMNQDIVRAYLGRLNGEPVATSLMVLAAGAAGMYNITTIPKARRRGIGARMTDLPLLEAKTLGYKAGILHSSELGVSVYRSIGFQEYCKIGQYFWSPQ
jgi:ribosomal protein S18 acetylase RimI-like enzyme